MINKNFVFYRAYNPIFTFKVPIMLENADPFLFENTSSYIYSEYVSTLNFTSLYKDRIYPEINNVSIVLGSNYVVSESIAVLDNSIDLQTNRSLLQQNYDYFIWIDGGICRDKKWIPYLKKLPNPKNISYDKMMILSINDKFLDLDIFIIN